MGVAREVESWGFGAGYQGLLRRVVGGMGWEEEVWNGDVPGPRGGFVSGGWEGRGRTCVEVICGLRVCTPFGGYVYRGVS